jgi:hypothetical protein
LTFVPERRDCSFEWCFFQLINKLIYHQFKPLCHVLFSAYKQPTSARALLLMILDFGGDLIRSLDTFLDLAR